MDTTLIIGTAGAALLLVAFVLQKIGVLKNESPLYNLLNLVGAGLLTCYAALLHSIPFVILEGVWALVAFWYVICHLAREDKNR